MTKIIPNKYDPATLSKFQIPLFLNNVAKTSLITNSRAVASKISGVSKIPTNVSLVTAVSAGLSLMAVMKFKGISPSFCKAAKLLTTNRVFGAVAAALPKSTSYAGRAIGIGGIIGVPTLWLGCSAPQPTKQSVQPAKTSSLGPPRAPSYLFSFTLEPNQIKPFDLGTTTELITPKEFLLALKIVADHQPKKNNPFNWSGDKNKFHKTNIRFLLTEMRDLPHPIQGPRKFNLTDAVTVGGQFNNGQNSIDVHLLADRLSYDHLRKPYEDRFVRLTAALGHEVYGNVQALAEKTDKGTFLEPINSQQAEINAFTAGVDFLNRLIEGPVFKDQSPEMQTAIRQALIREQDALNKFRSGVYQR